MDTRSSIRSKKHRACPGGPRSNRSARQSDSDRRSRPTIRVRPATRLVVPFDRPSASLLRDLHTSSVRALAGMPRSTLAAPSSRAASKPWGGRFTDVPLDAHRRPLLDDRRPGGPRCLPGRSSLRIDRAASDDTFVHYPTRTASKPWGGRRTRVPVDARGWTIVGRVARGAFRADRR